MKILLSAYACEPHRGSEPGIGWNWALELARLGHEIWVLTRSANRQAIEQEGLNLENLRFIYYDLPPWARFWKKGGRGIYVYYLLWQLAIFRKARKLSKDIAFDRVHHITFGTVRQPSFLGHLGIPFIFGPIAGGESAPAALRKSYPWKGKWQDAMRDVINALVRWDPFMHSTFASARCIVTTSRQTLDLIPKKFQSKCAVHLAVGAPEAMINPQLCRPTREGSFQVLFIGRLLYWKGIHLALEAFSRLHAQYPQSRFTIIGSGPDEAWLKSYAQFLKLDETVTWIPWMDQRAMMTAYWEHDVFLFPSLHDSGGMVVLEAFANGLPVVALDLGGPGVMVDSSSGFTIQTSHKTEAQVVEELVNAMVQLVTGPDLQATLRQGALKRAGQLSWSNQVSNLARKLLL